jgi:hypothetical protein
LTEGGSEEGGWEELVAFLLSRSSSSPIRRSKDCTSAATAACASGERVSQMACGSGGRSVMPPFYRLDGAVATMGLERLRPIEPLTATRGIGSASGFEGSTRCEVAGRHDSPTRGSMTNWASSACMTVLETFRGRRREFSSESRMREIRPSGSVEQTARPVTPPPSPSEWPLIGLPALLQLVDWFHARRQKAQRGGPSLSSAGRVKTLAFRRRL